MGCGLSIKILPNDVTHHNGKPLNSKPDSKLDSKLDSKRDERAKAQIEIKSLGMRTVVVAPSPKGTLGSKSHIELKLPTKSSFRDGKQHFIPVNPDQTSDSPRQEEQERDQVQRQNPKHRRMHTKAFTRTFNKTMLPGIFGKRSDSHRIEHFDSMNNLDRKLSPDQIPSPSQVDRTHALHPLEIPEITQGQIMVSRENPMKPGLRASGHSHSHGPMDDVITIEQIQPDSHNVVITSSIKTKVSDLVTSQKWAPVKDNLGMLLTPLLSSTSVQHDDKPKRDKGYRSADETRNKENKDMDSPDFTRRGAYKLKRSTSVSKQMRNLTDITSSCLGTVGGNVYLNRSSIINKDHHVHNISWRNAMDCVRDAVIVTDEKGIILFYNKRCVTMLEVYHSNIMDKNVSDVLGRKIIKPIFQSRRSTNDKLFTNNISDIDDPSFRLNGNKETKKSISHVRTKSHAVDGVTHSKDDKHKTVEIKHTTPLKSVKILSVMTEFYDSMYFLTIVDVTSEKKLMMKYAIESEKNNQLIKTLLPPNIIERIRSGEHKISDRHDHVVIGFCDVVGFTTLASKIAPDKLFDTISSLFAELDLIAERIGVYKVETAGDNYMMACGLFGETDYVDKAIRFMSEVVTTVKKYDLAVRTGINAGSVVSGVVGTIRPQLRIMGDTVNTASRMESHGQTGRIHVSQSLIDSIDPQNLKQYLIIKNEPMNVKGKGIMQTYFISLR